MSFSTKPASIVLVGRQTAIFDRVAETLEAKGAKFMRYASDDALLKDRTALAQVSILCAPGTFPLTRELIEALPSLKAVVSPFTGTEGFDIDAATDYGVIVSNGAIRENYESMAEAAVMLMLACFYNLSAKEKALRQRRQGPGHHGARMMSGATIGLYGYGNIAKHIVKLLQGWNVRFLIATRTPPKDLPANTAVTDLDTMLGESDLICVLAPLNDATRNILDYEKLSRAKAGAALVALSRGGLIDEDALVRLVKAGHFSNVAIDVFKTEPLPADSPLREIDQCILTPHAVGHTRESLDRMPEACAESILKLAAGELPDRIVNPRVICRLGTPPVRPRS